MTERIGEHFANAEKQRVAPVEVHGVLFEVKANKFNDVWTVAYEMPDVSDSSGYAELMFATKALQELGYSFDCIADGTSYWSKD